MALILFKGKGVGASVNLNGAGWDNLHPQMQTLAKNVLRDANKAFKPQGLSVGIFEGWRTLDRQREVMSTGNSFVSNVMSSYHPWGLAVDFVFLDKAGNWTWEPFPKDECAWYEIFCTDPNREAWNKLGEIIKSHGLEWGGDWTKFDGPHAQLTDLGRTSELKVTYSGYRSFKNNWS